MKLDLLDEKDNCFLKRKELNMKIDHAGGATPSKAVMQQLIAKQFKKSVENIEIMNIYSLTGENASLSKIFIWQEKKSKEKKEQAKQGEKKQEKSEENKPEEKK
ncbi:MAG: hypothetical protein ABIG30_01370 [Candidatus Aenigmatarchaeota archaeon]